jgi:hypothetical protein
MEQQMVTIIIHKPSPGGESLWLKAMGELDSLVRRMGFTIIQTASGLRHSLIVYQVTAGRANSLGDDGIEKVRRELSDLVYLHKIPTVWVGFGLIHDHA